MKVLKFLFCSILMTACSSPPSPQKESLAVLRQFSSNFCLLDHFLEREFETTDTNSLIFCKEDLYAPSYILVIKQKEDAIRGLFQTTDLSSHGLSASNKSQGVFFKGFSFEVEPLIWAGIKERSIQLVGKSKSGDYNEELLDAVPYLLLYGDKEFLANKQDSKKLCNDLIRYINDQIVSPMEFERDSIPR
jgi:hypothetical protein